MECVALILIINSDRHKGNTALSLIILPTERAPHLRNKYVLFNLIVILSSSVTCHIVQFCNFVSLTDFYM